MYIYLYYDYEKKFYVSSELSQKVTDYVESMQILYSVSVTIIP